MGQGTHKLRRKAQGVDGIDKKSQIMRKLYSPPSIRFYSRDYPDRIEKDGDNAIGPKELKEETEREFGKSDFTSRNFSQVLTVSIKKRGIIVVNDCLSKDLIMGRVLHG